MRSSTRSRACSTSSRDSPPEWRGAAAAAAPPRRGPTTSRPSAKSRSTSHRRARHRSRERLRSRPHRQPRRQRAATRKAIRARSRRPRRRRSTTCSPTRSTRTCSGSAARSWTPQVDERDKLEFSDARFDSDLFAESSSVDEADGPAMPATDAGALPLESAHGQPDFLRRAERKARWRSGPARLAIGVGSAIAAAAAAGCRSAITSATPSPPAGRRSRPLLVAWCKLADCTPRGAAPDRRGAGRQHRAHPGDRPRRASFSRSTLRNRSALPLAMPSVDLTLTDGSGQPDRAPRAGAARLRRRRA